MARTVYFDPFGQHTTGFRAGLEDEVKLQDQTRRARGSDYDFNNFAPLRLQEAQRANQFGQAALPYQINNLGLTERRNLSTLADTELGTNATIGQATGNYAPFITRAMDYGSGVSLSGEPTYGARNRYNYDVLNQGQPGVGDVMATDYMQQLLSQFGIQPEQWAQATGQQTGRIAPGLDAGVDQFYGFDRARQLSGDARQGNQDIWDQQIQQQQVQNSLYGTLNSANYNQAMLQAAQLRALGTYGVNPAIGAIDEDGL